MPRSIETRKAQRLSHKSELGQRLAQGATEVESHASADRPDRATEGEADDGLDGICRSDQAELWMIEAALERIAKANYGLCTQCGQPFTPFCQSCADAASRP